MVGTRNCTPIGKRERERETQRERERDRERDRERERETERELWWPQVEDLNHFHNRLASQ